jgi:hypothetical protein
MNLDLHTARVGSTVLLYDLAQLLLVTRLSDRMNEPTPTPLFE